MGILSKNYLHTLFSNVILKFVVGLVIGVVTARALGPAGRGEYNLLVLIITTTTTLLNFGIPATNTYFTAQKQFGREKLVKASLILAIVASTVSFGFLSALYIFRFAAYLFPVEKLNNTILVSLAIIPVVFFNQFGQGIILGENRIVLNNYITLSGQGTLALGLTVVYLLGSLDMPTAVALYAMSYLVVCGALIVSLWDSFPQLQRVRVSLHDYRKLLGFSFTIYVGNLTQFFNYRLDVFIVNVFLGTAAVGLYGIAANLGETLWLISASMASVLLPTLVTEHRRSVEISVKAMLATFAVSILGGLVAYLIGPSLIVLLFGEKFSGAITPFLILVPGIVVFCINNVLATYMTSAGRPGLNAAIAFVSFVCTIVLDIVLIPKHGISGAALASVASYTVSTMLTIGVFARLSEMTTTEFFLIVASVPADIQRALVRFRKRLV